MLSTFAKINVQKEFSKMFRSIIYNYTFALNYNDMLTKEFTFLHEKQPAIHVEVLAEIEYHVGRFKKEDSIKVVGEITDNEVNVYEISDKILINEFYWKFKDEIEEEREEWHAEYNSKLKDF